MRAFYGQLFGGERVETDELRRVTLVRVNRQTCQRLRGGEEHVVAHLPRPRQHRGVTQRKGRPRVTRARIRSADRSSTCHSRIRSAERRGDDYLFFCKASADRPD